MIQDYQPFIERMIDRYEGGYGWNPNDPGGPTKYGITCFDLAEHRHQVMDSMARWAPLVRAMTMQEADDIYASKYATACAFNSLGLGKDCVVFDFGVNSGSLRSVECAQSISGVVVDGILGPITLNTINNYEPRSFINGLCDLRLKFLQSLNTWSVFGSGWSARVADLRAYSLHLAFPTAGAPFENYEAKVETIPLAYGKAYDSGYLSRMPKALTAPGTSQ